MRFVFSHPKATFSAASHQSHPKSRIIEDMQHDFRSLYDAFNAPITSIDCGEMCAPNNPNGVPFCCDITHSVPVAFHLEWRYLQENTDLWHLWEGGESGMDEKQARDLVGGTPAHMTLLACKGAPHCQRNFRAISCRQYPFFPYITEDMRFIGLAYDWLNAEKCWVIQNLDQVTDEYRQQFVETYEYLLEEMRGEMKGYYLLSEDLRDYAIKHKQPVTIIHRDGGIVHVDPTE